MLDSQPRLNHFLLLSLLAGLFSLKATAQNAIVTDVASLQVAEGGFGTIRVRLQAPTATPLTVTVSEVDGGAENLYVSTSCRFWLYLGGTNWSPVDVGLFDLQTPATVDNFLAYVTSGAYENTFIHRKVENFVVQGGGFFLNDSADVVHIPTLPPVVNEPGRSNVRGTLAMAKVGGNPNSATSEWFFNVADNSTNLDFQNGGFAAFGQVLDNGMTVVDAINALPTFSYQGLDSIPYYSYTQEGGWNPAWLGNIEVLAGRQLLFDAATWNLWYEVRIHAAPDPNNLNGVRRIRLSAPGLASREVVVTEIDNAVGIVFEEPISAIPENDSAQIRLKLAAPPHGNVAISVQHVEGDPNLAVQGSATVNFSAADWNTFKTVTIAAANDPDAVDGEAIFCFSGAGVHSRKIIVHEADDDQLAAELDTEGPIIVPEGGTATFRVRLTAQPLEPFVLPVVWQDGDPDLDLATVARFHTPLGPVDVELLAAEAPYAVLNFCQYVLFGEFNGVFFHSRLDAPALLEGGLFGYEAQGPNYFRVSEFAAVPVDSATRPNWRGTLAMNVFEGNDGNEVVASHWFFNTGDNAEALLGYPVFGQVIGNGLETLDQIAALPLYDLESYLDDVFYPEEELNLGGVLAKVPLDGWDPGVGEPPPADPAPHLVFTGIELLSPPPLFTPDNWDQWQEVTLRARPDDDHLDGQATFILFVPNGENLQFTAIEADHNLGIVVDTDELAIPEGTTGQLGVRLSQAPLANVVLAATLGDDDPDLHMVAGDTLEFTPQNWNTWQYVEVAAAIDNDTENGETTLAITQAVGQDFIVNAPVVRVFNIDRHVRLTIQAGADGQTVPTGELLVDMVAGLPLPIQAIPDPGFTLLVWEASQDGLLAHPRLADNILVTAVDGATLTAQFSADTDGDALPDIWELQFVDDPTRLTPNDDPNRDGQNTFQNFLAQTHPLLLEVELTTGWNLLGLSAIPQAPDPATWLPTASSNGGPQFDFPVAWQWHPVSGAYRLATTIEPTGGYWIYATLGGTLGIQVQPEPPTEQLDLEAGWNLVAPPSPAWTGTLTEVFGDAIAGSAYTWNDGQLILATQVVIKQPIWVFAPIPRTLTR